MSTTFDAVKVKSGNTYIDGLLNESQSNNSYVLKWSDDAGSTLLTYSFPTSSSFYYKNSSGGEITYNASGIDMSTLVPFNEDQKAAVRKALDMYASIANIKFTEVTETDVTHANIRFGFFKFTDTKGNITGRMKPDSTSRDEFYPIARDTDVIANKVSTNTWSTGSSNFENLLHETGHSVGLSHPSYQGIDTDLFDVQDYTVMSYWDVRFYKYGAPDGENPQSLMMNDIRALQYLYGANYATNSGDTVYKWDPNTGNETVTENGRTYSVESLNNKVRTTVWDGGGTDTYDFSDYHTDLTVKLEPGKWSNISEVQRVSVQVDAQVYKSMGNIANAFLYNNDKNSLIENATGGSGNDTITGNQVANVLTGNGGNDKLFGLDGDDTLYGGAGNDTLEGGAGDDIYYVDSINDVVIETAGAGIDTIYSSVNYSLYASYVENLTLVGSARRGDGNSLGNRITANNSGNTLYGYEGNDTLYGGAGSDQLDGGVGDDTLVGGDGYDSLEGGNGNDRLDGGAGNDMLVGGAGIDTLDGGAGDDIYYVDSITDAVIEAAGAGIDTIYSSINYSLNAIPGGSSSYVENLTLTGSATEGSGNSLGNRITANNSGNTLYGYDGNDTLVGGAGADSLLGGNGNDQLDGGAGNDSLSGGFGDDSLIGGTGNDRLYGDGGNDTLVGGAGVDFLSGGDGNDTFVFKSATESTTASRDTIVEFVHGVDKIDLLAIDANTLVAGDQAFTFIVAAPFHRLAGELRYDARSGLLSGDTDGDGGANFEVWLSNKPALLSAIDFIL